MYVRRPSSENSAEQVCSLLDNIDDQSAAKALGGAYRQMMSIVLETPPWALAVVATDMRICLRRMSALHHWTVEMSWACCPPMSG